jgi:hypothetical protein
VCQRVSAPNNHHKKYVDAEYQANSSNKTGTRIGELSDCDEEVEKMLTPLNKVTRSQLAYMSKVALSSALL